MYSKIYTFTNGQELFCILKCRDEKMHDKFIMTGASGERNGKGTSKEKRRETSALSKMLWFVSQRSKIHKMLKELGK